MAFTVYRVLQLDAFSEFQMVAGANGLDRVISRGGIIDHETVESVAEIVSAGEFIFSALLMIKDQPERLIEFVEGLIEAEAAAFAIKSVFFKSIPEEVIQLANAKKFPIFLYHDTMVEDLLLALDNVVNEQRNELRISNMLKEICGGNLNRFAVIDRALKINSRFKENFMVAFLKEDSEAGQKGQCIHRKLTLTASEEGCLVHPYEEGLLVVYTSERESEDYVLGVLQSLIGYSEKESFQGNTGFSRIHHDLGELGEAIQESFYAQYYGRINQLKWASYEDAGVYQALFPMMNHPWIVHFFTEMIDALDEYDKRRGTDLLHTAQEFVKQEGRIAQTAQALYQHQNTVRYRIRKIYEVLGLKETCTSRYETLAIAIRLFWVHTRSAR